MRFFSLYLVSVFFYLATFQSIFASSDLIGINIQLELGSETIRSQIISNLGELNISSSNRYIFEVKPEKIQTPQSEQGDSILLELRILKRINGEKKLILSSSFVTLTNLTSLSKGFSTTGEPFQLKTVTRLQ